MGAMGAQSIKSHKWPRYVVVLLVGLALVALIGRQVMATSQQRAVESTLEASGVIHVEQVSVASEFGGRVVEVPVVEGASVTADELLVRLDTGLLDAQIEAAESAIAVAEAGLAQARAGARPGQIAVAEAQLAQAEAARVAAQQAVSDTQALVENPQDVNLQIAVTAARLESAQHKLAQAVALKDAVEIGKDNFEDARDKINEAGGSGHHQVPVPGVPGSFIEYDVPSLPLEAHLLPNTWWQAWVGVNAADAEVRGIEASLAQLYAQREQPQEMEAKADEALAALAQTEAQIAAAQSQVEGLRAGAIEEQIAALEARVAQAQAGLDALMTQREMMYIKSPMDGVVLDVVVYPGEVAAAGAELLAVANLDQVALTVYVPENRIGQVSLGQRVEVTVDSFPGRVFEGRVNHIANTAEFTPRNVATQEERVNLVFGVDILIANDDGSLKPGMPADAVFVEEK